MVVDLEEVKALVARLGILTEQLDRRSELAARRVEAACGEVRDGGDSFALQASNALKRQAGEAIESGMAQSFGQLNAQFEKAAHTAALAVRDLETQRKAFVEARRVWVTLGMAALLIGTLLAVAGSAYWVHMSRQEVARNQLDANLLRAIQQADVTLCGDALCANVPDQGQRLGDRRQYRAVKLRSAN